MIFGKEKLLDVKCGFWFPLQVLSDVSHSKKKWARYTNQNVWRCSLKYPLLFYDFNEILIFWTVFSKNTQISNFVKIRPVGAELFHADRRTDWRADMK